jgi:mono/diheme cytochrome c family protein
MRFYGHIFLLTALAALNCPAADMASGSAVADKSFTNSLAPIFQKYCYACHGNGKSKGDLALDSYKTAADALADPKEWKTLHEYISTYQMPPADKPQPTEVERDRITGWIDRELFKIDPAHPDPGRVTIHRLNRAEYDNTIRDLIGVDFHPADDFPPDDSGYGFDNIGDVLSLPPMLMEKYLSAADKILDLAIPTEPVQSTVHRVPATLAEIGFNALGDRGDGWVHLISLEEDDVAVELPVVAGDYVVRVQAFCTPTGGAVRGGGSDEMAQVTNPPPTKISIMVNDTFVQNFVVTTNEASPGIYEARVGVGTGRQRFRAAARRERGGANELIMVNGRIGGQQPGNIFVKWIEVEGPLPSATRVFPAEKLAAAGGGKLLDNGDRLLDGNGKVSVAISATNGSDYILRAQAYAYQSGGEPARMEFLVDGKPVRSFDVLAPGNLKVIPGQRMFSPALLLPQPQFFEFKTKLPPGAHQFSAAFVNGFSDPTNSNPNLRSRNLAIRSLEVADLSAPVLIPPMSETMQAYFAKPLAPRRVEASGEDRAEYERAAARAILGQFAFRAWRRPVAPYELDRLMKLYDLASLNGLQFVESVKVPMKAVLVSPLFLFRGEVQPNPDQPESVHPVDEFALASRLSYFLWSSMPDDELLDLAKHGLLRANLDAQVKRMLASPKASALTENFAGQWLEFRLLPTIQPDKTVFTNFDATLATDMQRETKMFFDYIMRDNRSVLDFLTADYTFANGRLAKFYGVPGVSGDDFQKVSLDGTHRRGVLTQGSVLLLTSNPTRTSPVKRGKWVLENLLGAPPPPPPPDVPNLDDKSRNLTGTLRDQMVEHRANPVCASCHARMDPIGFSLENFDAIGEWRDKDGSAPVDASGQLISGEKFSGASELTAILAEKKRNDFYRCLSEKMLTYALGRGLENYDRPATDKMVKELKSNPRFSGLVLDVVNSVPFQMQRGEGERLAEK